MVTPKDISTVITYNFRLAIEIISAQIQPNTIQGIELEDGSGVKFKYKTKGEWKTINLDNYGLIHLK